MKTDPNKGCANERENFFWAFVHDCIAHPLMALTGYAAWALRFHNYTSHRAWPRTHKVTCNFYTRVYAKNEVDAQILQRIEDGLRHAGASFVTEGSMTPYGYVYDVMILEWSNHVS